MLEIVNGYSKDFKVKFGGDKSKVMVINGNENGRNKQWSIGEVKIDRAKDYRYLGCMLSEDGCTRAKGEKVAKALQWYGRLSSVQSTEQTSMSVLEECGSMWQCLVQCMV